MKSLKVIIPILLFVSLIGVKIAWGAPQPPQFGSVIQAGEYNATSTRNFNGVALANLIVLNSTSGTCATNCPGTFGSVVITGQNTGVVNFYDATTSNINLRASSMASSTIFLGSFPTNTATGTYVFDVSLRNGLLYELVSGTAPTSTVTMR